MTGRLRLSPSASVTVTAQGAVVRSDLGALELAGADVGVFVSRVLPLLDGTRTAAEVAGELSGYAASSVEELLALLVRHRVVEDVTDAEESRWRAQERFFERWPQARDGMRRLAGARVLVAGLDAWGAVAATELASAGVGALRLLDDAAVGPADVLSVRAFADADVGRPRRDALRDSLARAAPWCEVTGGPLPAEERPAGLAAGFDLLVGALPADDLRGSMALARAAHDDGVRSLFGHLEGLDAVVGPAVLPGRTACWNCTRLRRLANAPDPDTAHREQAALLEASPQPRERTYLAPMAALLGHLIALEALKLLSGYAPSELVSRQLVQSLVSLEASVHAVVRMPWCEVCGGAAAGGEPAGGPVAARLDDASDPAELRERLAGFVDGRTGIIGLLTLDSPDARSPELPFMAGAALARYAGDGPPEPEGELGSGKALTATGALLGAAGEAIERYSAARYRREDLRRARIDELDGEVLDPRDLCLYDEEQYARPGFPYARFDPERPLHWTRARRLDDGEPVWVPALVAHYNFHAPPPERFCQVTSNGLAAGADDEDAALRATLELVERDAFTLTWLARLPARPIDADGALEPEVREVVRQLRQCGARVELRLLDAGIPIPVVACLGLGDGRRWPGATVALAAHPSPRAAARKAILEQAHVGPYIRRLMDDPDRRRPDAPGDVRGLLDHALYYVPAERRSALAFLDGGPPVALAELPEPPEVSLAACTAALSAAHVRVAVVDVTAPDVRTGPFRVARALGAHVQPIHFGHGLERLANPRLRRALDDRPPNPDPHPLA